MTMLESQELLAEYVKNGSETAFRQLVDRYVDLVYSTAFRTAGRDRALAEDITQSVFIDLARKARRLSPGVMLGGWLHRNTCFAAAKAVRGEQRRREREKQALEMNTLMNDMESTFSDVAPILDEAINQMEPEDRVAVLLRFYERRDFRSIGSAVGTSEDGARMRVNRALDRLQGLLRQRGVTLSAAALGSALTVEAVTAAPAGLSGKAAAAALAGSSGALGLTSLLGRFTILAAGVKLAVVLLVATAAATFVAGYVYYHPQPNQADAGASFGVPVSPSSRPLRIAGPGGSRRSSGVPGPTLDELAAAKQQLRTLLERPSQQTQYPPRQLIAALTRFGAQWMEAIPILLERSDAPDFETRKWAMYGLWETFVNLSSIPEQSPGPEIQSQAFSLARPKLSAILRAPGEPVELRRIAAQTLVPAWAARTGISASGEAISTPRRPLDEATLADVIAVLQSRDKGSEGFRFELIDPLLTRQVASFPEEGHAVRAALAPMLEQGDARQQFLAAFALAALPGENPAGLMERLTNALDLQGKADASYTYRAADALGMLGADAREAVPALLKFAEATRKWGNSGYREHALEAVCRIQPELRQEYPDIDAKLKNEEASLRQAAVAPANMVKFGDLGEALADPATGTNVQRMLVEQVREASDPGQRRQELLEELLGLWGNASESQRGPILQAMNALRATLDRDKREKPAAPSLRALLVDGRVLLLDQKVATEPELQELFNQWDTWCRDNPAESKVTAAKFGELSQAIQRVDAQFQKAWLTQVCKSYPNLDRVVRGEKE